MSRRPGSKNWSDAELDVLRREIQAGHGYAKRVARLTGRPVGSVYSAAFTRNMAHSTSPNPHSFAETMKRLHEQWPA